MSYMPKLYSLDNGIALGESMYSMLHRVTKVVADHGSEFSG